MAHKKARSSQTPIGDVLEISTRRGLAYAQVTHIDKTYGTLLRAIHGFHSVRPDLAVVVAAPTRFHAYTNATEGERSGRWSVIGHVAVPAAHTAHPLFRWATPDARTGAWPPPEMPVWYLWDGTKRRFVGELGPNERKLPTQMLLGPGSFVLQIETDDSEPGSMPIADAEKIVRESSALIPGLSLHLAFSDQASASRVGKKLEARGFEVAIEAEPEWAVRAQWLPSLAAADAIALQQEAEALAHELGGTLENSAIAVGRRQASSPN